MRNLCLVCCLTSLVLEATGCDDSGGGLTGAAPRVEQIFVGDAQTPGAFEATPESGKVAIEFGLTDVGTVSKRYLFLRNTGRSDLKLSEVNWEPQSSSDFVVACLDAGVFQTGCPVSSDAPLSVPPGSDLVVEISYAPSDVGPDQGAFRLLLNAADHTDIAVSLAGEGVTPEIEVCISDCTGDQEGAGCAQAQEICNQDAAPGDLRMAFGDVEAGQSMRRLVVLRNLGDRPLQVNRLAFHGGDSSQFFLDKQDAPLPGELAAGAEAGVYVVYQPAVGGPHATSLEVGSNDVNEGRVVIGIEARSMAPRLCPEPLVLDFGNVATGEEDTRSFTVTNIGLLDLEIDRLELAQDTSTDFTLVDPPEMPLVLAPEDSREIQVRYHPQETGSDHGGVDFYSNDPSSDPATGYTGTVSLLGSSVPRACEIQATPFQVDFGGVIQAESATMDLIIANQGTDSCTLERLEITTNTAEGEFAISDDPGEGVEFQPGEVLVAGLTYAPVDLGADAGVLTIFGNDKDGGEIPVDLNGVGVETAVCDLQIQPSMLTFGMVKVDNTKAMIIQMTNEGYAPCNVTNIELELVPFFGEDFTITQAPSTPLVIARRGEPGSQAEIEATFAPLRQWIQTAVVHVQTDDPDLGDIACTDANSNPVPGEACISLMGYAKESQIEIVPDELDFGVVTVGCNSPEKCITVYNLGSESVSIDDIYLEDPADPDFEITDAPMTPGTLGGGGDFQVCARYHPQDIMAHRSILYIELDGDETHTVPLFGRGTDISDQTDVFHQPDQVRADVLFVIDCSGSMGGDQQNLADNFEAFIDWAHTLEVDFHLGVIATEVQDNPGMTGDPPRQVHPGELVEVSGRPKIITNNTPDLLEAFRDLIRLGDDCSNTEAGLEAAWMALSQPLVDDPAINGGFLREDAKLYIIGVSDEVDQSRGSADFYVDFFFSIKGYRNTEMMAVSAICGDCPDGCTRPNGEGAQCGGRYNDVAARTGGIFESICTDDWNQSLQNLGIDAFEAIREFPLSRPADPGTITVTINGDPVGQASQPGGADGWSHYPDTNTIYFGDDVVPDKGDRIEVSYTAQCL